MPHGRDHTLGTTSIPYGESLVKGAALGSAAGPIGIAAGAALGLGSAYVRGRANRRKNRLARRLRQMRLSASMDRIARSEAGLRESRSVGEGLRGQGL